MRFSPNPKAYASSAARGNLADALSVCVTEREGDRVRKPEEAAYGAPDIVKTRSSRQITKKRGALAHIRGSIDMARLRAQLDPHTTWLNHVLGNQKVPVPDREKKVAQLAALIKLADALANVNSANPWHASKLNGVLSKPFVQLVPLTSYDHIQLVAASHEADRPGGRSRLRFCTG